MDLFQNTLYLYSILGALHVFCGIMAAATGIGCALIFGAWLNYKTECEEDVATSNLFTKIFFWVIFAFIIFTIGCVLIPSDSDLYIIYKESVEQASTLKIQ